MKESIEFKKEEKTTVEKLQDFKVKEMSIKKEDPTYGTSWGGIDPEKLDQGVLNLYELYENGGLKTAQTSIEAIREKIEKIKDKDKKEGNRRFINWLDDKIIAERSRDELDEGRLKE